MRNALKLRCHAVCPCPGWRPAVLIRLTARISLHNGPFARSHALGGRGDGAGPSATVAVCKHIRGEQIRLWAVSVRDASLSRSFCLHVPASNPLSQQLVRHAEKNISL